MSAIGDVADQLIKANDFCDKITLIRENSKKVCLPERCDVLVSETLSAFCFDKENTIYFIADARNRFLKPEGRIVPESADTYLLPFSSDDIGVGALAANKRGRETGFYGLDYKPFTKLLSEYRLLPISGHPIRSLSEPSKCHHIDFLKDIQNPRKTFVPFPITCDGRLDGFVGWFEARLCEGVTISNSPFKPLTNWWQLYLPAVEQPECNVGQTILLSVDPDMVAGDARWSFTFQIENTSLAF